MNSFAYLDCSLHIRGPKSKGLMSETRAFLDFLLAEEDFQRKIKLKIIHPYVQKQIGKKENDKTQQSLALM